MASLITKRLSVLPSLSKYFLKNSSPKNLSTASSLLQQAKVRHPAPEFKGQAVVDGQFKEVGLHDFKGKWLVLFFYPLDFTFVCPTEIIAFSDQIGKFKDINCEVVGVSTDSHFSHLAWINLERKKGGLGELKYPLLSDFSRKISDDYGVLIPDAGIALRGLFIIDPKVFNKLENGACIIFCNYKLGSNLKPYCFLLRVVCDKCLSMIFQVRNFNVLIIH